MKGLFATGTILGLCAVALVVLANTTQPTAGSAYAAAAGSWTYERFLQAFKDSGRTISISNDEFEQIQDNKQRALRTIETYLSAKFGKADASVMHAFADVPREFFHYNYANRTAFATSAYEEPAKPWAIGYGSALSDYLGQAYMTQLAEPKATDVVLEIGTGSGFQASLLSRIVKKAYSIEIIEALGTSVAKIFGPLNYTNIETRVGDGYYGWPEVKGGFDIIIVTCSAQYVPPALFKQLKPGGRLVIPIGQPFKKGQILYVYSKDDQGRIHSKKDVGVYFIPMTGAMEKGENS
jgi:protein-L-isoaspartate(D-aspartate) O-methyltransferase